MFRSERRGFIWLLVFSQRVCAFGSDVGGDVDGQSHKNARASALEAIWLLVSGGARVCARLARVAVSATNVIGRYEAEPAAAMVVGQSSRRMARGTGAIFGRADRGVLIALLAG